MRKITFLALILLNSVLIATQNEDSSHFKISLLFMGDIMGHDEQIRSAENRDSGLYNYDDVFRFVKDEISEADISIANFEVTLAGPPYRGYPTFSSPASLAAACKNAGSLASTCDC